MTDIPKLITRSNAPDSEIYAMECTLEVTRREVYHGEEKETSCTWSGFASLDVVNVMLDMMSEVLKR